MANLVMGDIQVDRIVEMILPFETPSNFFPDSSQEQIDLCKPWLEPWALCPETGKLILVVQSYLVRTRHHTILIDTCVGCDKTIPYYMDWNKRTDRGWLNKLAECRVSPDDVDYVFCTHLHCDHAGWNTQLLNGRWVPTFPNAKYIMSREDFEQAEELDESGYNENVLPVVEAGQAVIVDSDYAMDDNFWFEPTPGHTAGHVAVGMASDGKEAVMSGDLIVSPIQCAYPEWNAVSDANPSLAGLTRRKFLTDSCDRNRLVMTAHFPEPSLGRIVRADDAFRFVPGDQINQITSVCCWPQIVSWSGSMGVSFRDNGSSPTFIGSNGHLSDAAITTDGSGDIYVAGKFTHYNSQSVVTNLVRLNTKGAVVR